MNKKNPGDPAIRTHDVVPTVPRREFLKGSAAVLGATLVASCGGGGDDSPALIGGVEIDPLTRFNHLVVVMFENRSFDNVLGYLYPASSTFEGLDGITYSNPNPTPPGGSVNAVQNTGADPKVMNWPNPNPGEGYPNTVHQMWHPHIGPTPLQPNPSMQGFVVNYAAEHGASAGPQIMSSYGYATQAPGVKKWALPVFSALAQGFAVYDHWFCAVPSETYCNRSFFHASTSNGYTENGGAVEPANPGKEIDRWKTNKAATIFEKLSDAGKQWRIYTDFFPSLTLIIHFPYLSQHPENIRSLKDFVADATNGTLPDYAFVEPYMSGIPGAFSGMGDPGQPGPANSMHPNQNVLHAEYLLKTVYEAVKDGKSWSDTLLLVTFDEHGGCFDHVPPQTATPPPAVAKPEYDFKFDWLGVRVPAIAISAWTKEGGVLNNPVNHAAVIRTVREKYGISSPLTARDGDARGGDLKQAINLGAPRPVSSWPSPVPSSNTPNYQAPDDTRAATQGEVNYVNMAITYFQKSPAPLWVGGSLGDARTMLASIEAAWRAKKSLGTGG